MIRERRSRDKLRQYYKNYIDEGVIDPNVHPLVAQSWERSRQLNVPSRQMSPLVRLSKAELQQRRENNRSMLQFLDGLYREVHEHFTTYNLSLFVLDSECYMLKNFALSFYQRSATEIEGARLTERDIGTSSISVAMRQRMPFLLFGPEMWLQECHDSDACSAPIIVDEEIKYVLTIVANQPEQLPYSSVVALLLSMRHALENHLALSAKLTARDTILDAVPLAVYHILPGGEVAYTNKLGQSRLRGINPENTGDEFLNLNDVVLNYRLTPIYKGFNGIPSYNKEVTWITPRKTYEDITTVVPLSDGQEVNSVVTVSLPIEDLRTLVAHTAGYTARYSLNSIVGDSPVIATMRDRAVRAARNDHHLLLQGESGTGKQRLAHGIHQASSRAAGPLIAVKCGDMPQELLEGELFGMASSQEESRPGKLELANGGTLFLDEVEKLPNHLALRLADALSTGQVRRSGESVERQVDARIIAACDSDLKRLSEKGAFPLKLYNIIAKSMIRVPNLRARVQDIPILANHILQELAEQNNVSAKTLSPEAAEFLATYDWPGNIKQLQGVVEQAFFQTNSEIIRASNISLPGEPVAGKAWKEDRDIFIEYWKAAGGNISRLANMLDVSRVTLYRYMRKYGMEKN